MQTVEEFLDQAKSLTAKDRLRIVQELLLTLEPDGECLDHAAWNAAWLPELEARIVAYERGEATASDWRDVLARLRQTSDAG